jgi:hypothetical protein
MDVFGHKPELDLGKVCELRMSSTLTIRDYYLFATIRSKRHLLLPVHCFDRYQLNH